MKKYEVSHYKIQSRRSPASSRDAQSGFGPAPAGSCHAPSGQTCRLAFLTDLHNQAGPEETKFILHTLEREAVDAVLCGGDMIVAHPGHSVEPGLRFMQKLAEDYTVYAATGNHEYRARIYPEQYGTMYEDYTDGIREAGIHVLENACADVLTAGVPLHICGFDMPAEYYRRFRHVPLPAKAITDAIGNPDPDRFNILLAHNPAGREAYFSWGADLTLSGHYHGGVMRWGRRRGSISPDFRLFPDAHGLFEREEQKMIISAGCGEHTIPIRIHNPREIVILQIETGPASVIP